MLYLDCRSVHAQTRPNAVSLEYDTMEEGGGVYAHNILAATVLASVQILEAETIKITKVILKIY